MRTGVSSRRRELTADRRKFIGAFSGEDQLESSENSFTRVFGRGMRNLIFMASKSMGVISNWRISPGEAILQA
jgi:hypothetical protein